MYNYINPAVARARNIDEQFVIAAFNEYGWQAVQGTQSDDYNHIDLFVNCNGKQFEFDVKRNSVTNRNSLNYTFAIKNPLGIEFPFKENGKFAFIDDVNKTIIVIPQLMLATIANSKKRYPSRKGKGEYVIIAKRELIKYSETIITPSPEVQKILI